MSADAGKAARAACRWAAKNTVRLCRLESIIQAERRNGNRCIRRGDIWILAQQHGLSVSAASELRFDNSLWSGLSRLMIMRHPEFADCLHTRKCAMDDFDFGEIWAEELEAVGCRS